MSIKPADPHRPAYHFLPEANWLNDPNGLIQWKGLYHLFYQYNPNGPFHGTIHWGHAVSEDLVNWEHLPIALAPTPDSPDQDGCYSGCAVNNNGVATFIYTGVRGPHQLPCVATSTDDRLINWQKYPNNPVIASPPPDLNLVAYRDHCVWKEGDIWYQVIGAGIKDVGGTALLYRSPDLLNWEYLHPILVGDLNATDSLPTGEMWECPALVALNDKHVLLISVWTNQTPAYSAYYVGDFTQHRFTPLYLAVLDNGGCYYAPQTMWDDQGRCLMWGWLWEERSSEAQRLAGWSGVMSLPRILSVLPDNRLAQTPVPELQKLRTEHLQFNNLVIPPGGELTLPEIKGDCLEIMFEFEPDEAESVGVAVRCSPDGSEQTIITYDRAIQALVIDREHSSLDSEVPHDRRVASYPWEGTATLKLHIFLDRSVLEVFINDEVAMASRIYPTRADSLGLRLVASGGKASAKLLDIWKMQGSLN